MKKIIGLIIGMLGVILTIIGVIVIFKCRNGKPSIGIIGGADRPTAVFIVSKIGGGYAIIGIIAGLMFIMISGILLFKKKR